MNKKLKNIAEKIMTEHKGILAFDERPSSADKNLKKAGIKPSSESRKRYREIFLTVSELNKYINAVILHEETFYQDDSSGNSIKDILLNQNIEIAIKVDGGTEEFPESPQEFYTKGLNDLDLRLKKYYEEGARLAKWRSVFKIDIENNLPSEACIKRNTEDLAVYAKVCQEQNMVPIVEPEVLLRGDHTIEECEDVSKLVLTETFNALLDQEVDLSGVILKASMVLPGKKSKQKVKSDEIAKATVRTLLESVPDSVPGVVFLSGGQNPEQATTNLNEIAKEEPLPWKISFSFLRAVLGPPTKTWGGLEKNVDKARKEFIKLLDNNVRADEGTY